MTNVFNELVMVINMLHVVCQTHCIFWVLMLA